MISLTLTSSKFKVTIPVYASVYVTLISIKTSSTKRKLNIQLF